LRQHNAAPNPATSATVLPAAIGAAPDESRSRASVIIVNYNAGATLRPCIESINAADFSDMEIILFDNASTDGSVEMVERYFPDVRIIRSAVNLGFSAANNAAALAARGEYLAFLNPDTLVEPGWLERLIAALERNPRAGLATPKILLLDDPERINTCGMSVHFTGLTLCRGMGAPREAFGAIEEVDAVSGAAFVMRSDLFTSLGGFDSALFMYMEDTDLSWRARLQGYRCIYVPDAIVYHRYTLRFGRLKVFYQERNRYLMLLKSLRWGTLPALLPALLLAEALTWAFVLLRERERMGNKVRAYAWIVRHWPAVMASRRRTQLARRVRDRDLLARCAVSLAYEQTGDNLAARLAHIVFDPLFSACRRFALALVRW
jgi:hypothetical protein